jgi:hypothetical protein
LALFVLADIWNKMGILSELNMPSDLRTFGEQLGRLSKVLFKRVHAALVHTQKVLDNCIKV